MVSEGTTSDDYHRRANSLTFTETYQAAYDIFTGGFWTSICKIGLTAVFCNMAVYGLCYMAVGIYVGGLLLASPDSYSISNWDDHSRVYDQVYDELIAQYDSDFDTIANCVAMTIAHGSFIHFAVSNYYHHFANTGEAQGGSEAAASTAFDDWHECIEVGKKNGMNLAVACLVSPFVTFHRIVTGKASFSIGNICLLPWSCIFPPVVLIAENQSGIGAIECSKRSAELLLSSGHSWFIISSLTLYGVVFATYTMAWNSILLQEQSSILLGSDHRNSLTFKVYHWCARVPARATFHTVMYLKILEEKDKR